MTAIINDFRIGDAVTPSARSSQSVALLRIIVAILVMAHHAMPNIAILSPAWEKLVTGGIFMTPHGRIEFFFVASALLVSLRHHADLGRPDHLRSFVWRRFIGIYPLYWLVLAPVLILGATIGFRTMSYPSATGILAAITLVGSAPHPTTLTVAWTLFHEILFYAVFTCGVFNRRLGMSVAAGWLLLVAAHAVGLPIPGIPDYFDAYLNLLFLFGVGGAAWLRSGRSIPVVPVGGAVLVAASALLWENVEMKILPPATVSLAWGVLWSLALTVAIAHERRHGIRLPTWLLKFSDVSFMLYLIHFPLLSQVLHFMKMYRQDWNGVTSPEAVLALLVGICVAAAVVGHRLVELPLRNWLRQPAKPLRRPAYVLYEWRPTK